MDDGSYICTSSCPKDFLEQEPFFFETIKRELNWQFTNNFLPKIVDSGKHHVLKISMLRDENPRSDFVTFYLKILHSTAKEQIFLVPNFEAQIPSTARICCQ